MRVSSPPVDAPLAPGVEVSGFGATGAAVGDRAPDAGIGMLVGGSAGVGILAGARATDAAVGGGGVPAAAERGSEVATSG
ncbi:MAG TPA: hypothetical protein VHQ45_14820, partial [Gemmatimonadaceae bacterium]|nr:hypothetical protein [Gemmatimonadaceae bacterium]